MKWGGRWERGKDEERKTQKQKETWLASIHSSNSSKAKSSEAEDSRKAGLSGPTFQPFGHL